MSKVSEIVDYAFREITSKGYFDVDEGNKPIPGVWNKSMSCIPSAMTQFVNECGKGCCFVFSAYMMKILNEHSINNFMVATVEGEGIRASVMYEDDGEFYIANPVEDIEFFTEHGIKPEDRAKFYDGESATMVVGDDSHNDSRYTLEEFEKKYGTIKVIGSMNKDSETTLCESMSTRESKIIMPPEKANYDVKKLLREKK